MPVIYQGGRSQFDDYNTKLHEFTNNETINDILLLIDEEVTLAPQRKFGDSGLYTYCLLELRKALFELSQRTDVPTNKSIVGVILKWQGLEYQVSNRRTNKEVCNDYFKSISGLVVGFFTPTYLKSQNGFTQMMEMVIDQLKKPDQAVSMAPK